MRISDLITQFDYNYWATARLMKNVAEISENDIALPLKSGHESIKGTLVHIMNAEAGWFGRCGGPERGPRFKPADFPTLESIRAKWQLIESQVREFLSGLSDEQLDRTVEYTNDNGETRALALGELLQHAATHGVHHRGQVALMLRQLGRAPDDIDLLMYWGEKHGVPAW